DMITKIFRTDLELTDWCWHRRRCRSGHRRRWSCFVSSQLEKTANKTVRVELGCIQPMRQFEDRHAPIDFRSCRIKIRIHSGELDGVGSSGADSWHILPSSKRLSIDRAKLSELMMGPEIIVGLLSPSPIADRACGPLGQQLISRLGGQKPTGERAVLAGFR